jgi:hypothetical protein
MSIFADLPGWQGRVLFINARMAGLSVNKTPGGCF